MLDFYPGLWHCNADAIYQDPLTIHLTIQQRYKEINTDVGKVKRPVVTGNKSIDGKIQVKAIHK